MIHFFRTVSFFLITSLFVSLASWAQPLIEVNEAHIRATLPGTQISSAYMSLHNLSDSALTLKSVTSDVSERIEIHNHVMTNGMMQMRQKENIIVAAHSQVNLKPGGLHLMIFNLSAPLKAEQVVKLTLHFDNDRHVTIQAPVEAIKPAMSHHKHH